MVQLEHWSLAIVISLVCTLLLFITMIHKRDTMLKICKWLFAISATGGLIIYTFAFLPESIGFYDIFNVALRAIFSTMRMFVMNSDLESFTDAIGEQYLQDNAWLAFLFLIIHVLAAVFIQAALLSIFGRKIIDYYRLHYLGITIKRSGIEYKRTEVFIINGCDKNALVLGENIATNDKPNEDENRNRIVIFWIGEDDDEKQIQDKVNHFNGIVQKIEKKHNREYFLQKAGMGKRTGSRRKFNIIFMPASSSIADDVCEVAKFAQSKNIKKENLAVYAFVLSAWSKERVQKSILKDDGRTRRYDYIIHIINIVDLLVRQMISTHPPYRRKGLGIKNGKAARGLNVMILGFGPVGENTLMHFVMNGQFQGKDDNNREIKMQATIVDSRIDSLEECFHQRYPGLNVSCDINFYGFDVRGKEFFELLKKEDNIDYIVVTLNNDELNKQIALDILRFYKKQKPEKELPVIAVFEKDGVLYEQNPNDDIYIYGCREEVLKDSIIIRENLDTMAKAVHDSYVPDNASEKEDWYDLNWFSQESNRATADFIPAMLFLASKTEEELLEDGVKSLTDDDDLKEVLSQTEHLRWNAFHVAMGYSPLSIEQMQARFNKVNKMSYARKDSDRQLHACLVSWDELDNLKKVYNKLAQDAGDKKEAIRDFKNNDRTIITSIPEYLKTVHKAKTGERDLDEEKRKVIFKFPKFMQKRSN